MKRKAFGDSILWAVTKSMWWTATCGIVLALISKHQGVGS